MDPHQDMLDFVHTEAQLIWNRYSVMTVAHSVFLGLVLGEKVPEKVIFASALAGGAAVYLWWMLTSTAWELLHHMGNTWLKLSGQENTAEQNSWSAYRQWRKRPLRHLGNYDIIWVGAHGLIWLFLLGYSALAGWKAGQIWEEMAAVEQVGIGLGLLGPGILYGVVRIVWKACA